MEQVHTGGWTLSVDVPKTKALYEGVKHRNEISPWLNYIEMSSFADMEVQAFFDLLGIEMSKPSQLFYHQVEGGSMLMYTGSYHLYGDLVEGEIDGWDVIIGGYCLSLTQDMEAVPAGMSGNIVEISFEVVLPWMLELPIPSR
ncbi:MAG: hypothetical protein ACI33P_09930 [Lysinibacillus sp.]